MPKSPSILGHGGGLPRATIIGGGGAATTKPLPTREQLLEEAMPAIREAVIATLPAADAGWQQRVRNGLADDIPVMRAGIAGWLVAGCKVTVS